MFADRLFNALERNEPAPGQLLVAAPGLDCDEFNRTVVLLLEHDENNSFGVVLNRRLDLAVANVLEDWAPLVSKPQAFYIGGPLQQQSALAVGVSAQGADIESNQFLRRIANRILQVDLQAEPEDVAEALSGMRFFVGYAEWSPGQLQEEIERGDWYVTPALPSDVIASGASDLWFEVMRRQPMPLPLFATYPDRPEDN